MKADTYTTREDRGWVPAKVGCHWTRGDYTISTISQGTRSGYIVVRHPGQELASFVSWHEAELIADRHAETHTEPTSQPRQ